MREIKGNNEDKKAVKYTTVDWNAYKVGRGEKGIGSDDEGSHHGSHHGSHGSHRHEESFSGKGNFRPDDVVSDSFDDKVFRELKDALGKEDEEALNSKKRKKKSLNTKLEELGRENNKAEDSDLKSLENNIIKSTEAASDDFLAGAVKEVSKALEESSDDFFLNAVSEEATFELPKLDIHFGDTAELSGIQKAIENTDFGRMIAEEDHDLEASIESETAKEILEQESSKNIRESSKEEKLSKEKKNEDVETKEERKKKKRSQVTKDENINESAEKSAADPEKKADEVKAPEERKKPARKGTADNEKKPVEPTVPEERKKPARKAAADNEKKSAEITAEEDRKRSGKDTVPEGRIRAGRESAKETTGEAKKKASKEPASERKRKSVKEPLSEDLNPAIQETEVKRRKKSAKKPNPDGLEKPAITEETAEKKKKSGDRKASKNRGSDKEKVIVQSDELKESRLRKKKSSVKADKKLPAEIKRSVGEAAETGRKKRRAKTGEDKKTAKSTKDKNTSLTTDAKKPVGIKKAEKAAKSGPSEFRKRSADWKDKKTIEKTAQTVSFKERRKQFATRIKNITPLQWSIAAMGLVILLSGVMTSAVYANYQGEENKKSAIASLNRYKEDDSYAAVAEAVTENMFPEAAQEPETPEIRTLSLEMTSVEKDLKIKLVDDEDTLVKDVTWSVTVQKDNEGQGETSEDSDDSGTVYEDDDRDGIIYITDIAAGEYSVTLNPSDSLADYILPQEKQLVSVKATIEYKVIANIRDEIKTEKEVNVALEDPNGNQAADVETAPPASKDTVEWVESSKTIDGEEYVEATPDLSKTATAVKKENGFIAAIRRIGSSINASLKGGRILGFRMPAGYLVATSDQNPTDDDNGNEDEQKPTETPTPTPTPDPTDTPSDILVEEPTQIPTATPTPTPAPTLAPGQSEIDLDNNNPSPSEDHTVKEDASLSVSGQNSVAVGSSITLTADFSPSSSTVSWSVSDSSIASITDNGKTCEIKGIKGGSVTVTATCSNGKSTTVTVNVSTGEYSDDAKLYDASKNLLYVKDGDNYRPATYADYKSGSYSTYYRKQEGYLYTGWQNIEGKTYYYRSDHTYVTGEQIIQGIKYTFGADGALATGSGTLGIDVSKYQPSINWASVKASGVNYAIIRCGYRGASTGVLIQDPYFTSHIKGAKAAGLKVGVYFFTTALTEAEAVEEASMCAALCSGYGINYPIFIDCENSSRPGYNSMSAAQRTQIIKAFCNTIKSAGYTPGVYANKTWLTSYMNTSALGGCKIWLAQYNAAGPTYSGRYDIWQYTSKGKVDGISGYVDMNQSYLGY